VPKKGYLMSDKVIKSDAERRTLNSAVMQFVKTP
jgi:hypothetical protein